jgi:hypothetical protein
VRRSSTTAPAPSRGGSGFGVAALGGCARAYGRRRTSRGLVDPCLLDALAAAGYERSHEPTPAIRLPTGELAHLFRALKAPAAARALPKLAGRARGEEWSYERFAEALLSTEISSRESSGGRQRIKAARFSAHKTLEEFDFTFQRSVQMTVIQHLGQLDFLHGRENVVLLGPPGTAKHICRSRWGSAPAWPATALRSPRRPNGSPASATPNAKAGSKTNCGAWAGSRC